jgi:hypothetical protein
MRASRSSHARPSVCLPYFNFLFYRSVYLYGPSPRQARDHLMNNDLDSCQHQCVTLLRIDPANKEASMMLAVSSCPPPPFSCASFALY